MDRQDIDSDDLAGAEPGPAELATTRRAVLKSIGLTALGATVGASVPTVALAQAATPATPAAPAAAPAEPAPPPPVLDYPGKDTGLTLLGDSPLVAETPAHLLDDDTTPTSKFFIRNNGQIPEPAADPDAWEITIDGEVEAPLTLTVGELKARFENVTYRMVLECGGNGRSFFVPAARGNQWTNGGAGCAEWTGVRLADVLAEARPNARAIYTAHFGADPHLSGEAGRAAISRGVRLEKALNEYSLVVFGMNGEPLPHIHGGPVRLLYPGWPGSASQKWLTRIQIREVEHDGQGMKGFSYRVPIEPMVPGADAEGQEANFRILESMPVRSIITSPAHGTRLAGTTLALRGAAWDGENTVEAVDLSIDGGQTWTPAELQDQRNPYDWRRWTASIELPSKGYYEVLARATDSTGKMQAQALTNWNPQGYGGNKIHQIAVLVE